MIVEVKELKKVDAKKNSEVEKIIQQAKIEEKTRIKGEKKLAIQAKLEKKILIQEEKKLTKKIKQDEKKIIKKKNKIPKNSINVDTNSKDITMESSNFMKLVEKITKRNILRPYPDINDIQN